MRSQISLCIRTLTLIRDLYIQLKLIFHLLGLNRLSAIAIYLIQSIINYLVLTYPLIRSGGIRLNL